MSASEETETAIRHRNALEVGLGRLKQAADCLSLIGEADSEIPKEVLVWLAGIMLDDVSALQAWHGIGVEP